MRKHRPLRAGAREIEGDWLQVLQRMKMRVGTFGGEVPAESGTV